MQWLLCFLAVLMIAIGSLGVSAAERRGMPVVFLAATVCGFGFFLYLCTGVLPEWPVMKLCCTLSPLLLTMGAFLVYPSLSRRVRHGGGGPSLTIGFLLLVAGSALAGMAVWIHGF